MCIIFFSYKSHPQYKLIVAANRDEFYKRATKLATFWDDCPSILGGRDLEQNGTWMAIKKNGSFGMVTNYRDFSLVKEKAFTRGNLVKDYLMNNEFVEDYLDKIKNDREKYNPFNLILGDNEKLYYYSNVEDEIKKIYPGIYGVSNHLLDTPWPKILRGKRAFQNIVKRKSLIEPEELFKILSDDVIAEDKKLPNTGIDIDLERMLSPIFIKSPDYGTRAQTVLLIDNDDKVTFIERSLVNVKDDKWNTRDYEFKTG